MSDRRDERERREEIGRRLEELLLRHNRNPAVRPPLSGEADLTEDLRFDSLTMMAFVTELEQAFGVVVGGREIEDNVLKTVARLQTFVERSAACGS